MSRTGDNIFKRKDGRWEGRYIKSRENGKAKYGYVYSKSYKEAKAKLQSAIRNNVQQSNLEQSYFKYWLDYWLKLSKLRVKESTYVKYNNSIRNHIEPELGNLAMNEITTMIIESYINKKLYELSPKSVSELLIIIKDSIRSATAEGAKCPCQLERLFIKYQSKEMRVLSKEEEQQLIEYLVKDADRYKMGVLLCLFTGIRIGELCALQGKDISISEKSISITKTMQRLQCTEINAKSKTRIIITEPKSNKSKRIIPLPDNLVVLLYQFPSNENEFFLSGSISHYVEPRVMQDRFKKYLQSINISNAGFHCLRHTFATRSIEVGFDIKTLSEILGHSSVKTTMDRYVHTSTENKRTNMNKLNSLYSI